MKRQKYSYSILEEEFSVPMQKITTNKHENTIEAQVQDGDTLASIALKFHCTVAEIRRLNKIDKDNEIYARKIIKVPITPHSILLETLPTVHKSGQNSPKTLDANETTNNNNTLKDEQNKLNEKLLVASVNSSEISQHPDTINNIILNSKLKNNLYEDDRGDVAQHNTDSLLSDDFDDAIPQPRMIRGPNTSLFDWSGSDCDISWICLFIFILALCFAIPLIYIVYIAEHYEKFHHNSTFTI